MSQNLSNNDKMLRENFVKILGFRVIFQQLQNNFNLTLNIYTRFDVNTWLCELESLSKAAIVRCIPEWPTNEIPLYNSHGQREDKISVNWMHILVSSNLIWFAEGLWMSHSGRKVFETVLLHTICQWTLSQGHYLDYICIHNFSFYNWLTQVQSLFLDWGCH